MTLPAPIKAEVEKLCEEFDSDPNPYHALSIRNLIHRCAEMVWSMAAREILRLRNIANEDGMIAPELKAIAGDPINVFSLPSEPREFVAPQADGPTARTAADQFTDATDAAEGGGQAASPLNHTEQHKANMAKPCTREDCSYSFEKHGRVCHICNKWMVDFGD